jgi:hypothetical protein
MACESVSVDDVGVPLHDRCVEVEYARRVCSYPSLAIRPSIREAMASMNMILCRVFIHLHYTPAARAHMLGVNGGGNYLHGLICSLCSSTRGLKVHIIYIDDISFVSNPFDSHVER